MPFNYHRSCEAMGTRFEVILWGGEQEHLEAVAVAILEEVSRLSEVLSRFDPRSEIARINRSAASTPVRVDREVFGLLETCERARRLTGGHFDVTVSDRPADATTALRLSSKTCAVQFTRPDVAIDLGGIGKGYALDRARAMLGGFGVTCGLLNGGTSSVLAVGSPKGEDGWPVDVRHPLMPDAAPVARLRLTGVGLSCSAVRRPGQPRSDIVNPLTGRPLSGDAACLVLAPSATEAEILSTALLSMGREKAKSFLERGAYYGLRVGWIDADADFDWIA
jgi:FAD:protein FMN transferase